MSSAVRLKKGESVERSLRRLKRKVDKEDTLQEVRRRRFFEKPADKRRRKKKDAKFLAMLRQRDLNQWL